MPDAGKATDSKASVAKPASDAPATTRADVGPNLCAIPAVAATAAALVAAFRPTTAGAVKASPTFTGSNMLPNKDAPTRAVPRPRPLLALERVRSLIYCRSYDSAFALAMLRRMPSAGTSWPSRKYSLARYSSAVRKSPSVSSLLILPASALVYLVPAVAASANSVAKTDDVEAGVLSK